MSDNDKLTATTDDILIDADAVYNILKDIRMLFRFNPYYEIKAIKEIGADTYELFLKNEANNFEEKQVLKVTRYDADKRVEIRYDSNSGRKIMTAFDVRPAVKGVRIVAEDAFDLSGIDKDKASDVIDRTIPYWLSEIRAYLKLLESKGFLNSIRLFYKDKIWLPMTPFARRVTRLILVLTALESIIILVVLIFFKIYIK